VFNSSASTMAENSYGSDHPMFLDVLMRSGNCKLAMGKFDDAERIYERVVSVSAKTLADDTSIVL